MANSAVFSFRQNAGSDWISLTEVGREFQARDAAAGNARSPVVVPRVGGTTSVDVEADRRRRVGLLLQTPKTYHGEASSQFTICLVSHTLYLHICVNNALTRS